MSLDINKLLDEVEADVKKLLKSAQEDAEGLKKAEESKAEASKKEESKKEDKKEESKADLEKSAMAKADEQEGSGYDSQAPEASEAPAEEAAPAADEAAAPAAEGDQAEDLASVMQGLDDDTLHELYQKIKMELMARMQSKEGADAAPAADASAAPAADASAAAPDLAMKSEKESTEKLSKAESELKTKDEEIGKLKKSLEDYERGLSEMTDMLKQVLERPVQRALTDISFVGKDGGEGLKKSEMSNEDIKKAVDAISSDRKKLSTLTKSEIDAIQDFYAGKNVKDKVLKIVNK